MQKFRALWERITGLPHLQSQALLLRYCASVCKVVHLFRTVPPHLLASELGVFDAEFRRCMETVTGPTTDFTWAFMSLGCTKGGLGLRSAEVHSLGGFLSSFCAASPLLLQRFPTVSRAGVESTLLTLGEDWSSAFGPLPAVLSQRALSAAADDALFPLLSASPECPPPTWLASIQSPTSSCFWRCLPSRFAGTYVDDACFRTLVQLRYRQQVLYPSACLGWSWCPRRFWRPRVVLQGWWRSHRAPQPPRAARRGGV